MDPFSFLDGRFGGSIFHHSTTMQRGHPLRFRSMTSTPPADRSDRYGQDVLSGDWRRRRVIPTVAAELDMVLEDAASGFCGAIVASDATTVTLEDRHGKRRVFGYQPAGFEQEGKLVTLTPAV